MSSRGKLNSAKHTPDRGDKWDRDIEGAAAEMALAKALGRYYEPTNMTFKGHDGCGVQVRSTRHPAGHLIIRDNDSPDEDYFLVTGERGDYVVRGWIRGSEAMRSEYRRTPDSLSGIASRSDAAWFVPQSALKSLEEYGKTS